MKSSTLSEVLCGITVLAMVGCALPPVEEQAHKAGAQQYKLLMDYADQKQFGQRLPREDIGNYMRDGYSDAEIKRIQSEIDKQFDAGYSIVIEKWASYKVDAITKKAEALVESALQDAATNGFIQCAEKFEMAREIVWQESIGAMLEEEPVSQVDEMVRAATTELLDTKINPKHWPIIEREMRSMADAYCAEAKFDEAVCAVSNYPLIRVYTSVLDDKLDAVAGELVRLGIAESGIRPLREIARKAMTIAANLADNADVVATEEKENRLDEGNNPDADRYRQLLKEYHDALVLYNCTERNADKITSALANNVEGLIEKLRRDPKFGKEFLKHIKRLGASAINKRIVALQGELLTNIDANRKVCEDAILDINKLMQGGDFKSAQKCAIELSLSISQELAEEEQSVNGSQDAIAKKQSIETKKMLRAVLIDFITTKVNPELWASIEKEILEKTEEFCEDHNVNEGIAWLYAYPYVRTYAEEIDQRYADVKAEAVALGVPEEVATRYIDEIMVMTAPMDNLADYSDFYFERVTPGTPLTDEQLAKYEKALGDCRKALVKNNCTAENADKLVEEIRARFAPEFAKIGGETREQGMVLGACALNKRLAALKDRCMANLIARCAGEYAEGEKFEEARALIRDIDLVGNADFDAKVYAVRVGVLNSIVNPLQLIFELAQIDAKGEELVKAGKYRELLQWVSSYPCVHDTYADIEKAVEAIGKSAVGIRVAEDDADVYVEKLRAQLNTLLEQRAGDYIPSESAPDLTEMMKALSQLENALFAQYYDAAFIAQLHESIPADVLKLLENVRPKTLTTWELNEQLHTRLNGIILALAVRDITIQSLIEQQEYLERLAAMDQEFSYDSQIAMAEDAIAKQLGVKCPKSHFLANAVLGEYARAMRLLKLNSKLTDDQLTAMVLGSVYLDQPVVFTRAIELGADVNGVTERDQLRRTALLFAIQLGRLNFVHRLVAAGADISAKDAFGDTAVHYAVRRGTLALIKTMLEKVDVNAVNADGATALFDAARLNSAEAVQTLIDANADIAIVNKDGFSAFDIACEAGSRDVLDAMVAAGSVVGSKQLAIAADKDHLGVAQWLVMHGADVNGDGVMASTKCGTDTKRYLINEGGIAPKCDCDICNPEKAAGRIEAIAELSARGLPTIEGTGSFSLTVKDGE